MFLEYLILSILLLFYLYSTCFECFGSEQEAIVYHCRMASKFKKRLFIMVGHQNFHLSQFGGHFSYGSSLVYAGFDLKVRL
jgi:hypothetical protein